MDMVPLRVRVRVRVRVTDAYMVPLFTAHRHNHIHTVRQKLLQSA